MAEIRALTNGYAPPADAGAACRLCLNELEAFERELHVHLHIEADMLFPKVRALAAPAFR